MLPILDIGTYISDWSCVLKRLGYTMTIFAFLTAIGVHWAVLQSFAWTSMLAQNLRTQSLSQAVEQTFDGQHPCPLCCKIAKNKRQESKTEFSLELKKFEFTFTLAGFSFLRSWNYYELSFLESPFPTVTHAPPIPPPRASLA